MGCSGFFLPVFFKQILLVYPPAQNRQCFCRTAGETTIAQGAATAAMRLSVDNRQIFHRADRNTMPATAACLGMNPWLALILGGLRRKPEPLPQQSQNPARQTQALLWWIALPQLLNGERNFLFRPPNDPSLLLGRFFQNPLVANTIRHEQMQTADHLCAQFFEQSCPTACTISA